MKNWRVVAFGVAGLAIFVLLRFHEHIFAAAAAILIVAAVVLGFLWSPTSEIFYVHTLVLTGAPNHQATRRDRIAVKAELDRLWLLFLPTVIAVGLLLTILARGTSWWGLFWNISPVRAFLENGTFFALMLLDGFLGGVILLLSAWLSERWVLQNADVCSARSVMGRNVVGAFPVTKVLHPISYGFQDQSGGYYGGVGFPFRKNYPVQLRLLVFYRRNAPQQNKIAMCCLFHRFVIVGRGVKDFDEASVAAHSPQPATDSY